MKNFVIAGHCSTKKKLSQTTNFLKKIKQYFDCKILYVDHLECPREITELVDYSLHIKYNPIQNVDIITDVTREFRVPFWHVYKDDRNIEKICPIHSYAHHNSLVHAFKFLYENDAEIIHFLNYDCDDDTFDYIEKNDKLLHEGYHACFFPYRYDPLNGVCTEFFSISRYTVEKMFLKMTNYGSYEDRNIIRSTDYNIEYTYHSHLHHRNIKYYLHDMWPTRDGEVGISNFHKDLNNTDEIVISYNNPNSHICSVIPFMDHSDGFQVRILFMRHGGQIGEKILVKFLDKDLKPKGICEYDLPLNGYFFLSPTDNSKYVSTSFLDMNMTFDLHNLLNYGEVV